MTIDGISSEFLLKRVAHPNYNDTPKSFVLYIHFGFFKNSLLWMEISLQKWLVYLSFRNIALFLNGLVHLKHDYSPFKSTNLRIYRRNFDKMLKTCFSKFMPKVKKFYQRSNTKSIFKLSLRSVFKTSKSNWNFECLWVFNRNLKFCKNKY